MGSAKVSNATPQLPIMADKKSIKKLLKVFFKKDKKKEKGKEDVTVDNPKPISIQAVDNILEKIQKLDLKEEDDELKHFSFKTVSEEGRTDRSQSHSSVDSGIATKYVEDYDDETKDSDEEEKETDDEDKDGEYEDHDDDDIIDDFKNLRIGDRKKQRKNKVVVTRAPLRNKSEVSKQVRPYFVQQTDACRQVQINKNTLTGGQVIVNKHNDFLEFDNALKQVQKSSQFSQHEHGGDWLNIVTEYIQEVSSQTDSVEDILSEFLQTQDCNVNNDNPILTPPHQPLETLLECNPIEEFSNHVQCETYSDLDLTLNDYVDMPAQQQYFPTPPHSENASSPMSDSQSYRNSDFTFSPERSSMLSPERSSPIYNSDYEKFQEIGNYDDYPTVTNDEKCGERKDSSSSMTMKQYKDLQKEISLSFSKKECCQLTRKSCKQIFTEHLQKLKVEDRKDICFKVTQLDLKNAYGVLQNILISLSKNEDLEDLQYSLFVLVSERVLTQKSSWFVDDFGLNLLKSAALRCPHRPILTRFIVHCIRSAIQNDSALAQGKDSIFHEVDALGDTLVTACVRRGDACADVLAEITRPHPHPHDQPPLFRVNHVNADGASALHVACSEHSADIPRLHCTHILLEHAGADLWQGDAKAGDTALHMAVNSRTCELRLIMVIFRHLDRKTWKKLAHVPNMCSTTPLEYARSAMKSQTREGYPSEVLEFLKKCR